MATLTLLPFSAIAVLDATVATALAAGLALIGAVWTLSHADATARRTLTAGYRARWDHPDLLSARVSAAEFLSLTEPDPTDEDARWEEWFSTETEVRKRLQVMAILNFWEEVASAYNQDLLDDAWFRTDLAWQLQHNWGRAGWFIRKFRVEQKNTAFFCEWQIAVATVSEDLKRQSEEGEKRAREALGRGEDLLDIVQQMGTPRKR